MLRGLMALALVVFLFGEVSAIRISEVEMNPAGTDAGNEWIEFYSEEEISLEGYRIINGDGKEINLSGNFSGYFVYAFSRQWLDNSNESVFLYNYSEPIDKTDSFEDSKNNDLTWQLCDGNWIFANSTKEQENNCMIPAENNSSESINQTAEEVIDNSTAEASNSPSSTESRSSGSKTFSSNKAPAKSTTLAIIELNSNSSNSKDIKSGDNKEILKKNLAFGGIVTFCMLFGGLFFLRFARRKTENEFR